MNPSWATEQLRLFIASTVYRFTGGGFGESAAPEDQIIAQSQVIEQIFDQVIPRWKGELEKRTIGYDRWSGHREIAQRALAQLERDREIRDNLGEKAPDLSAARMHPWVWHGAQSLWSTGQYRAAVSATAVQVNAESQNKLGRRDLSEVKLFQEPVSLKSPGVGKPRLRLTPDDGSDTFRSMHEGASAFAVGCYRAIRNPASHIPLDELTEDEALEQLAAFSVLARWVDAATVDAV